MFFGLIGMILGVTYFYNGAEQKELIIATAVCAVLGLLTTMLKNPEKKKQ